MKKNELIARLVNRKLTSDANRNLCFTATANRNLCWASANRNLCFSAADPRAAQTAPAK